MLTITIPATEMFDDRTQEFVTYKAQTLQLEHSLVSISKWESRWHKPYLGKEEKTYLETIDYIKCMTITQNVNPEVYTRLTNSNVNDIISYIDDPMTATTFSNKLQGQNKEVVTSELIYYWMITLNIPMECQRWHINRLLTLIRVCEVKQTPPKKRSKKELASSYASLNAARRSKLGSKG